MARTKKQKVEFNIDSHGEDLKKMIEEAVNIKSKIQLFSDSIKDIRSRAKEELGLTPKQFNALVKLSFNRNKDEVQAEIDELISLYEQIDLDA